LKAFVYILIILLLFTFTQSCRKFPSDLSWDTDLKVPILHSKLDVGDIFADSLIQYNPDQSVSLIIRQHITGIDNNSLVDIYDTLSVDVVKTPVNLPYPFGPGAPLISQTNVYHMELGDLEIKEARARNAIIKFMVINRVSQPLYFTYEVLSSDLNGSTFSASESVPAGSPATPMYYSKQISLSHYMIDFTGLNHDKSNVVRTHTQLHLHQDADTVYFTPPDSVEVISIFEELEMDYAKGYFGQIYEQTIDTSSFQTFDNFNAGTFDLEHAKAWLEIENGLGVDVQMRINQLQTANTGTGVQKDLNHDIVGKSLNIMRATETGDTSNPVLPQTYIYEFSQSNVAELIELMPDQLRYNVEYQMNPLGNISGGNDFVYRDYTISGDLMMEIPLNIRMDSLTIEEISSFSFDDEEKIKTAALSIHTKNSFPFDVAVQFYLLDSQQQIVDSLITENNISRAGIIGAQGFVQQASEDIIMVPLDQSKLNLLRNSNEILVKARMQSQHVGNLQLYEHYNIDIKVVLEGGYEY
jgi:hypothetical protein